MMDQLPEYKKKDNHVHEHQESMVGLKTLNI